MRVKELKKLLENINDERMVILQKDAEGNGYSPCRGIDDNCAYDADSTYSGTIGKQVLYEEDKKRGYSEEDISKGKPALVLYPIN
jgi:hypothetical protein